MIQQYPGKEVKKGLEQLYKKLEKHLVEQSSLLQVVWRHMQVEEFMLKLEIGIFSCQFYISSSNVADM